MKFLSWNIRDIISHRKQTFKKKKIQTEQHDVIFIQESKYFVRKTEELWKKLGRQYDSLEVEAQGSVGGLTIC